MNLEQALNEFILEQAKSDSTRPLDWDGDQRHAERLFLKNVWWPAFRNFDSLRAEYKVRDYKDGTRYIDFVYLRPYFRIAIEVDGIGPHWRNIDQEKFSDHCMRQNHLVISGWHVLRLAYWDVKEHSAACQQVIQQLIGRLTGDPGGPLQGLNVVDREIVRLALNMTGPITPKDAAERCAMSQRSMANRLKRLCEAKWLAPAGHGQQRVRSYTIHSSKSSILL